MLPTDFYLLNATTLLLWLFQTCSHEVLIILISLGVIVVVISLFLLVLSSIRLVLYLAIDKLNSIFRKIVLNYLLYFRRTPSCSTTPVLRDAVYRRIISDSSTDTNLDPLLGRRLSLPQLLALHPAQWAAIESAVQTDLTRPAQIEDSVEVNTSTQPLNNIPTQQTNSQPTLRRSRRTRRVRTFHSS